MNYIKQIPLLIPMYNEPHRHYHNITHIHELINLCQLQKLIEIIDFKKLSNYDFIGYYSINEKLIENKIKNCVEILQTVAWFHDCYYDPYAPTGINELMSKNIFDSTSPHLWTPDYRLIASTIILTLYHNLSLDSTAPPVTFIYPVGKYKTKIPAEAMIFMDLDLFGFSTSKCFENSKNIRKEYYATGDIAFNKGRVEFLTTMLNKPFIYYTVKDEYELAARENIEREIEFLNQISN